jgi:hypothetical protein
LVIQPTTKRSLYVASGDSQGSALGFLGPKPALGVSRRNIQTALGRWLKNQHCASWQNLGNTQRQARELISGPNRGAKAKLLSFNRTQSRVVTGLLTGHNTLRRHLHLLGLVDSPMCRSCGLEEQTSAHILTVRPWPRLETCTWAPFSWSPRTFRVLTWEPSGAFSRPKVSLDMRRGTRACY